MMVRTVVSAVVVLVACLAPALYARQEPLRFEKALELKQQMDGGFLRDSDGFLWIGGTAGLYRYDGWELKSFKAGPGSISSNWVRAIVEDHDGIIWIGSYNSGVTRYDKRTNTFTHYKHDPGDQQSLSHNAIPYEIQSMLVDRSGVLWIATQGGGLNRYDKARDAFTHFRHDPHNANSISSDKVTALLDDREGYLWVGTEDAGLNRFHPGIHEWVHFRHDPEDSNSLSDIYVGTLIEDREGILWVGTQKGGLNRYDRKSGRWRHYTHAPDDPHSISSNGVAFIHEDRSGRLWLCHDRPTTDIAGLDIFDKKNQICVRYGHNPDHPHSPSSNLICRVYEDPVTGIFWIVNAMSAIDQYDPKAPIFKLWQHHPKIPGSLSSNGVTDIYEDSREDIWIGSMGGLDRLDRATGTFAHFASDPSDPEKLPYKWISAMLEDSEGEFWVASKDVLTRFDRETGKVVQRYAHRPDDPGSITRCKAIRSLIQDRDDPNILWLGTHGGGVDRFDKQRQVFTHYKHDPTNPNSLSNDVMRVIYDDGQGVLWIPTFKGLNRFDKKTQNFTRYYHDPKNPHSISSDFLLEVYEDNASNLWIIGKGGLSRYVQSNAVFINYTHADGFPDSMLTSILQDHTGFLWMGSAGSGLIRFDPQTERIKIFTAGDGLQGDTFWGDSRFKTRDGRMWFGGANGANSFYPAHIVDNPYIPPIVLTALRQGGVNMDLGTAPEKVTSFHLDWRANFFEFQFAALNYTQSAGNQYAYMLQGVDKDWYFSGKNPFGRYSNLPGGTYTLRLKGANNDGIWNEQGISVHITVVPPLWQRAWFQVIAGLLVVSGIITIVMLRFRAVSARKQELEIQLDERNRLQRAEIELDESRTEKRRAQMRLTEQLHFLQQLLDSIPIPVYYKDRQGLYLGCNTAFEAFTGLPKKDIVGKTVHQVVPKERADQHHEADLALLRHSGVQRYEVSDIYQDGKNRHMIFHKATLDDAKGRVVGTVGALVDITERKQVEEELKRSSNMLRAIIEAAPTAIIGLDLEGNVHSVWNPAAEEMLGWSAREVMGRPLPTVPVAHQEESRRLLEQIRHGQRLEGVEVRRQRRDGSPIDYSIFASPLHDAEGRITGSVTVLVDITERRQSEEELKKYRHHLEELVTERTAELADAKEAAEAANRAKSVFLANMSHELRTPLNTILGYTQLMQRGASSLEEQREYLSTINRSGKHLLALINDVLEISRIEAGKLTFESKTFDLPTLLHDLKKAFDSSIDAKGLFFEIIGIEDVPRYVITDENKLRQVLVNLLGNAVKFTEQGGITLRVCAKDKTDGDMRLAVEVQDSGVGIAEDEENKVFAYFDQTASGRAQKNGTGLGLAISRDYVRMMGGDITLTSEEAKGCTFRFEINIKEGRATDLKARISKQRVVGLQPGQKVPRVLVAEDKRDSRTLLVKLLAMVGFEVDEAADGKEAVEKFNKRHPDFIWIDIGMPVMDGYEATRQIRATRAGKSTVIVALTAHVLEEESKQILDTGCDGFVRKPYREQEIFEMMAKHLGLKYDYEEKPVELEAGSETEAEMTSEQLANLPADIRNRLQQAAIELDEGRISNIIEQIKAHDAHTAAGLKTMVHHLEFRRLLNLLQGAQTKPGGSP